MTIRAEHRLGQLLAELPLAQQRTKGKEPSLRGALRLAETLQAEQSAEDTDILDQDNRSCRDPERIDPDDPMALLQSAKEDLNIVARQLKPLYASPARTLEDYELRATRRYLQQLADTLATLHETLRKEPPCPSPQPPSGGVAARQDAPINGDAPLRCGDDAARSRESVAVHGAINDRLGRMGALIVRH